MTYRLQFSPYHYRFQRPLRTHHGVWEVRSGILLTLIGPTGDVGYGEIAPVPWFGSETLEQALAWCQQLPPNLTEAAIFSVPEQRPACQFGLESAYANLQRSSRFEPTCLTYSRLLPAGEAALTAWKPLYETGYRTFKWKIGVASIDHEIALFHQLSQTLPAVKLRLDANGGLTVPEAERWLDQCDRLNQANLPAQVEYVEQPLPPTEFKTMQQLCYQTPIALDESIATLAQLQACYEQGWRGVYVIKPAIAGSPTRLRQFCQKHAIDAVFSTVFETAIGRQAGLRLAAEAGTCDRAVAYDGTYDSFHYFAAEPIEFKVRS